MASLKGSIGLGSTLIGMVSLRQAMGDASFTSRSVEAGGELATISSPSTRLSVLGHGFVYDAFGHLGGEKVNVSGLGLSLGLMAVTAHSPLRFGMGYGLGREQQEWYWDQTAGLLDQDGTRSLAYSHTYRAGFYLPLTGATSNPLCLALLREISYVQDRGRRDHGLDLYSVGLALQP
jgi:hypothetical protein